MFRIRFRASMVNRWRRELTGTNASIREIEEITKEASQIKTLRRGLREVTLERDILKKAVGIFSKSDR